MGFKSILASENKNKQSANYVWPELHVDPASKLNVQKDHREHLDSAESFWASLCHNTELEKIDSSVLTLSFDFQQNLPLLHIPVGDLF